RARADYRPATKTVSKPEAAGGKFATPNARLLRSIVGADLSSAHDPPTEYHWRAPYPGSTLNRAQVPIPGRRALGPASRTGWGGPALGGQESALGGFMAEPARLYRSSDGLWPGGGRWSGDVEPEASLSGGPPDFETIFAEFGDAIFSYVYRLMGNADD